MGEDSTIAFNLSRLYNWDIMRTFLTSTLLTCYRR